MKDLPLKTLFVCLCSALMLTACGGSGGGSGSAMNASGNVPPSNIPNNTESVENPDVVQPAFKMTCSSQNCLLIQDKTSVDDIKTAIEQKLSDSSQNGFIGVSFDDVTKGGVLEITTSQAGRLGGLVITGSVPKTVTIKSNKTLNVMYALNAQFNGPLVVDSPPVNTDGAFIIRGSGTAFSDVSLLQPLSLQLNSVSTPVDVAALNLVDPAIYDVRFSDGVEGYTAGVGFSFKGTFDGAAIHATKQPLNISYRHPYFVVFEQEKTPLLPSQIHFNLSLTQWEDLDPSQSQFGKALLLLAYHGDARTLSPQSITWTPPIEGLTRTHNLSSPQSQIKLSGVVYDAVRVFPFGEPFSVVTWDDFVHTRPQNLAEVATGGDTQISDASSIAQVNDALKSSPSAQQTDPALIFKQAIQGGGTLEILSGRHVGFANNIDSSGNIDVQKDAVMYAYGSIHLAKSGGLQSEVTVQKGGVLQMGGTLEAPLQNSGMFEVIPTAVSQTKDNKFLDVIQKSTQPDVFSSTTFILVGADKHVYLSFPVGTLIKGDYTQENGATLVLFNAILAVDGTARFDAATTIKHTYPELDTPYDVILAISTKDIIKSDSLGTKHWKPDRSRWVPDHQKPIVVRLTLKNNQKMSALVLPVEGDSTMERGVYNTSTQSIAHSSDGTLERVVRQNLDTDTVNAVTADGHARTLNLPKQNIWWHLKETLMQGGQVSPDISHILSGVEVARAFAQNERVGMMSSNAGVWAVVQPMAVGLPQLGVQASGWGGVHQNMDRESLYVQQALNPTLTYRVALSHAGLRNGAKASNADSHFQAYGVQLDIMNHLDTLLSGAGVQYQIAYQRFNNHVVRHLPVSSQSDAVDYHLNAAQLALLFSYRFSGSQGGITPMGGYRLGIVNQRQVAMPVADQLPFTVLEQTHVRQSLLLGLSADWQVPALSGLSLNAHYLVDWNIQEPLKMRALAGRALVVLKDETQRVRHELQLGLNYQHQQWSLGIHANLVKDAQLQVGGGINAHWQF